MRRWATQAELPDFSTHTFRHLRLTHLARAGWRLHEIAAYAGHRDPRTTQIYLHLSGTDLSAKMAGAIAEQDRRVASRVWLSGGVPCRLKIAPVIWQPFERAAYRLDDTLSEEDRRAISTAHGRTLYQQRRPVPPLLQPLVDIARRSGRAGG